MLRVRGAFNKSSNMNRDTLEHVLLRQHRQRRQHGLLSFPEPRDPT